jgi:hypothetical protein
LIPAVVQTAVVLTLMEITPPASLPTLLLQAGVGAACFALAFWFLGIEDSERVFFRKQVGFMRNLVPARFLKEMV